MLNALRLDSGEKIIIVKLFRDFSSATSRFRDIIDYKVITNRRIIFLRFFMRNNRFQISDYFFLRDISRLDFQIRHKPKKRERLFYLSLTKVPFLSFSSGNETYEINLLGVMHLKKKIKILVDELLKYSPSAEVSISWKRDDFAEASEQLLYEGMSSEKKRRLRLILLLLCVVWIVAIMRIFTVH